MLLKSPTLKSPSKKKFLNSINYFRGIAIIIIVLGHCYDLSHWNISNDVEKIFYSSTLNGSIYFLFISGFLYYHIFYHKFNYQEFMTKKVKYVLLPYLFCSIIPVLFTVLLGDGGEYLPSELKHQPLLAILWYFLTGKICHAYWYIPMVMLLFAISPIVNWIIKSKYLLKVILFSIPISMIVQRPIDNINPIHSLIYFFPIYLLGIWSSIHHQKIYAYLRSNNKKIMLLLVAIAIGAIQVLVFKESGNFNKEFWSISVPDINLIQKILFCFLLMSILDTYEDADIATMKKVAETSFPIYFIHPFLINAVISVTTRLNIDYEGNFFTLIMVTCLAVIISMAIAYTMKAIFKQNSRYLIGW
jgi:probable poly-beta-1,6-N-acetyl-D-glucosamine export protein